MAVSKHFAKTLLISGVILVLSVTAALLPTGKKSKEQNQPVIEINENQDLPENFKKMADEEFENTDVDFLFFKLKPADVEKDQELAERRAKESLVRRAQQDLDEIWQTEESEVKTYSISMSRETKENLLNTTKKIATDDAIYETAIKKMSAEECEKIENEKFQENCQSEIYFQKAIGENNPLWCRKITNEQLKARCESRF